MPGAAALGSSRLVGKDGKIHACYRVKGKPKGALRVVRGVRARCRRGERKVAWVVAGAIGQTGATGAPGSQGTSGEGSTQVTIAGLTEEVELLSGRVKELESVLEGVSHEDLARAIESLPVLESVCEQSEALTEQVNLLRGVIGAASGSKASSAASSKSPNSRNRSNSSRRTARSRSPVAVAGIGPRSSRAGRFSRPGGVDSLGR